MQTELLFLKDYEENEQACVKDANEMKRLMPKEALQIQQVVEDVCDKLEYDGSQMYAEIIDQEIFCKLVEEICEACCTDNEILVRVLLCHEMYTRRCRRCRRKRILVG